MVEKLTKAIIATEVVREASRRKCCHGSGLIKLTETSETLEQSMLEGTIPFGGLKGSKWP